MAIGELQLVIEIHENRRQQLSRQEKGFFGGIKTVNY